MSRIGKKPVLIPEGVDVEIDNHKVVVKGPLGVWRESSILELK